MLTTWVKRSTVTTEKQGIWIAKIAMHSQHSEAIVTRLNKAPDKHKVNACRMLLMLYVRNYMPRGG